jgi:glycosyltransferase involved in cell wall biosynthesis
VTRIIYFSRDYTTHDYRFLSALANTQYEVFYLRLERRKAQFEDRPLPSGIRQISWVGGKKASKVYDGPNLLVDLRRVIRSLNPDLIHAGPLQRSAFLVALLGFKPLISMSWGYDLLQDVNRNMLWRRATQFTLRRSAIMVGDCNTIRQKAIQLGMPDDKIVTFPWGVDLNSFTPGEYPPDQGDKFTILSTRGWEPIYGVDVLAKAFVKAANQYQELRLILLGNGSQANYLRNIFTRGGVMDRVLLPGQVTQADLPHYYNMVDLYVSASHIDGSSVSLMEALACGRPVVVSDIPGNREWVESGVNGWWFEDGQVDDLAMKLLQVLDQRQQLIEMSRAARKLAEERADWGKNFPNLLNAYEAALIQA